MFKASIALVVLAFATLAYGWIRGNDLLLYSSIGFSALAGLALMRSTIQERRAHPELTRKGRAAARTSGGGRTQALKDRDRQGLAELRSELSELRGATATQEQFATSRRKPLMPFGEPPAGEELEELPEEVPPPRPRRERGASLEERVRRPQPSAGASDDFRSRLSAVLGEEAGPEQAEALDPGEPVRPQPRRPASQAGPRRPAPERELEDDDLDEDLDVGSDWIRIDDIPRVRRATQKGGGYGRPEPPANPPKRRTAPTAAGSKKAASSTSTPKRSPAAKEAPAKPRGPRSTKSDASEPRIRPKPKA